MGCRNKRGAESSFRVSGLKGQICHLPTPWQGQVCGKDREFSFGPVQLETAVGYPSGDAGQAFLLSLLTSHDAKSHHVSPMVAYAFPPSISSSCH